MRAGCRVIALGVEKTVAWEMGYFNLPDEKSLATRNKSLMLRTFIPYYPPPLPQGEGERAFRASA